MDSTCFTYEILLTRDSENYKGIKYQDRYMIYVCNQIRSLRPGRANHFTAFREQS
jgi:hypothetical protein